MARSNVLQNSFLSGVLDPRAAGRIDADAYQNGLLVGVNIVPVHLGGVRRRPGLKYLATMPNQLTRITAAAITAPQGGTTANANDDDESTLVTTTGNVGTVNPYVVVQYDLGAVQTVASADVLGIVSEGGASTEFVVQYSADASTWINYGSALNAVDTTSRWYRRVSVASARYWRLVKIGGTDMGAFKITISGFNLWLNSSTVSEGRLLSFEVSTSEPYEVVLTDRAATIFENGLLVGYAPMPYASADLSEIDATANAETMVLVHEDYPPRFLVRETGPNFQTLEIDFDSLPETDFADALSPAAVSAVQVITFDNFWIQGDSFQVSLDGAKSGEITYAGDSVAGEQDTTASNIQRAVQSLWTVEAFTGVSVSRVGTRIYMVTFADASAAAYGTLAVTPVQTAIRDTGAGSAPTAYVTVTTEGVSRREPIWSATRGYPRTVEFFEGRLYFGGTRSMQQTMIGSQVNNILTLEVGEGLDDDPIMTTLNGRQLNAIQGLFAGRSLQMFTSGGEFRYVKDQGTPVTPGDYPVNQTQYGAAKIRPVSIDGATVFIQRNRKSVRDFRFDYTENAYNSLGVSALASHLIYDVRDLAAWNGSAVDEIGLVFVVNGTNPDTSGFPDGTVAVFNSRKEANVQAWTIWTTQGKFKAVGAVNENVYFLVRRTINGTDALFLEQASQTYYTDCAVQVVNGSPTAAMHNLFHLTGEELRVRADGFVLREITPDTGGDATIDLAATSVEVGLNFNPAVTPMPLQAPTPFGSNSMRRRRIVKVMVRVRKTLGLLVNGFKLKDRAFDINNFDEAATPYSGVHEIELPGNFDNTEDKLVSFTQVDPLPMEILGIDVQLEGAQ